jgi:hypothetical protein
VLTLCSGSAGARAGTLTLGHFAAARWQRGETEQLPEMFVAGEGLARGARDVPSDTTVPGPTAAAYEPELTKHGPERAYRCHSGVTCRGYLRAAGTSAIPGRRDRHRARA